MKLQPPGDGRCWTGTTDEALDVAAVQSWIRMPGCGAEVVFAGTVRDHSEGRTGIELVEYEAWREEVDRKLEAVAARAASAWGLGRVVVLHRFGVIRVGEVSIAVAVSAAHREEAFAACRWCIDTVKATVPIWKREQWPGGSGWALDAHAILAETPAPPPSVTGSGSSQAAREERGADGERGTREERGADGGPVAAAQGGPVAAAQGGPVAAAQGAHAGSSPGGR